jgi:Zn-dependent metalloprotease
MGRGPEGPTHFSLPIPRELSGVTRSPLSRLDQARQVLAYLRDHGLQALPAEVSLLSSHDDDLGYTHIRVQQTAQGIPVYGADLWLHFTPDGQLIVNGRYQRQPDPAMLVPGLTEAQAVAAAKQHLMQHMDIKSLSDEWKARLRYEAVPTQLMIYTDPGYRRTQHLAYQVTLRPNIVHRHELFIDAQTGALLHDFDHTCSIATTGTSQDLNGVSRTIDVWNEGGTYHAIDAARPMYTGNNSTLPSFGQGILLTADVQNNNHNSTDAFYVTTTNPNSWDPTAVSAHFNTKLSYDYFRTKFQRNSIDGNGGDVISYINVVEESGQGMDNAYWNGAAMFYGNGNGAFSPLAGALDVGGHEMSHGVIQETANLVYQDQPGALNESFADIFGVMIDRDDWFLGEDVTSTSYIATGRLRDMSDPHNGGNSLNDNGWQPNHMNEIYTGTEDNGGVHINSGIVNRAFYLYATAVGKEDAEQVYYRALANYLTRSSEFIDCRLAVVQAATDLFGANSNQVSAARTAYDQVGILNGNSNSDPVDIDPNSGSEYVISTDFYTQDNGENIYVFELVQQGATYAFTLPSLPRAKVSVQDNGQFGYFVGEDNHIYRLGLNPSNAQDFGNLTQVSNSAFWDNVAISKDGLRLAAVSTEIDTAIYVFDFGQASVPGIKYRLYIPNTAQNGGGTEGVLYADALAWDAFGEFLMYDAFNQLPNQAGTTAAYWDINFLRAWDNSSNDFGDGQVFALFSGLDPGVSVGNPVFSKNSPYIIAFDFIDENTNELSVLAADIDQNQVNTVVQNNSILGYPEFSVNDDYLIYNVEDLTTGGSVYSIGLGSDKITPAGAASEFVSYAHFGVTYATGNRVIGTTSLAEPALGSALTIWPVPTDERLFVQYELSETASVGLTLTDLTGRVLQQQSSTLQPKGVFQTEVDLSQVPVGMYLLQVQVGKSVHTERVLRR